MSISKEASRTISSFETKPASSEGKSYHVPYGLAMASLRGETSALGIQTLWNLTTTPPFRSLQTSSPQPASHTVQPLSACPRDSRLSRTLTWQWGAGGEEAELH